MGYGEVEKAKGQPGSVIKQQSQDCKPVTLTLELTLYFTVFIMTVRLGIREVFLPTCL